MNLLPLIFATALVAGACASPAPSPTPGPSPSPSAAGATTSSPAPSVTPVIAADTDGRYRLELDLPRTTWPASDPVDGSAALSVAGSGAVRVWGSGSLLGFSYDEVGGLDRHMDWLDDLSCGPYQLTSGQPIVSGLEKGGAWGPAASGADFYASFYADPLVHLPPGDWRISALASFEDGVDCSQPGAQHRLLVTVLVHVSP